jgi:hypothetical protein
MLDFFINRFYKNSRFSFLAKSRVPGLQIAIHLKSTEIYNVITHKFTSTEPEVIYADISFIANLKQKYSYEVHAEGHRIYHGHFQAISQYSENYVKFGFVACNDNSVIKSDNPKFRDMHCRGASSKIWREIQDKSYDILVHNGDNIYNDSTFKEYKNSLCAECDNSCGEYAACREDCVHNAGALEKVRERLADLFCQTYADEHQGQCMRESWNFHQIDDHDVTDYFGTPGTSFVVGNKIFHDFYRACKSVLDRYLVIDRDDTQTASADGEQFQLYNYAFNVNKNYKLVFLDTRQSLYFTGSAYSDSLIDYCRNNIVLNKINIIITPRPLFHMSLVPASVVGLFVKDARDSTWHYKQHAQSKKFCNMLFYFAEKTVIFVISGDIHETYIQSHCRDSGSESVFYELVTSGVTRTAQSGQSVLLRIGLRTIYLLDRVINFFCANHKIRDVRHRSFENNFGELVYNQLYNYTYKD